MRKNCPLFIAQAIHTYNWLCHFIIFSHHLCWIRIWIIQSQTSSPWPAKLDQHLGLAQHLYRWGMKTYSFFKRSFIINLISSIAALSSIIHIPWTLTNTGDCWSPNTQSLRSHSDVRQLYFLTFLFFLHLVLGHQKLPTLPGLRPHSTPPFFLSFIS